MNSEERSSCPKPSSVPMLPHVLLAVAVVAVDRGRGLLQVAWEEVSSRSSPPLEEVEEEAVRTGGVTAEDEEVVTEREASGCSFCGVLNCCSPPPPSCCSSSSCCCSSEGRKAEFRPRMSGTGALSTRCALLGRMGMYTWLLHKQRTAQHKQYNTVQIA